MNPQTSIIKTWLGTWCMHAIWGGPFEVAFLALFPTITNGVTCIIVDAIKNPLKCEHHQLYSTIPMPHCWLNHMLSTY